MHGNRILHHLLCKQFSATHSDGWLFSFPMKAYSNEKGGDGLGKERYALYLLPIYA